MSPQTRVGVVEIGSRAVRLLVADVSPDSGLAVVTTDWRETGLGWAVDSGGSRLDSVLDGVGAAARHFAGRARGAGAERIAVIATEALRRTSRESVRHLEMIVPELRVISSRDEAWCSMAAAALGLPQAIAADGSVFAVDQGSGSMEVIRGRLVHRSLTLVSFGSYRLGTQALVKLLRKRGGDLRRLQEELGSRLARCRIDANLQAAKPIVMGSAATQMVWIQIRADPGLRYDPRRVHGRELSVGQIDAFVQAAERDPTEMRRVIDPRNPGSSEFETVVAGLMAVRALLARVGKTEFFVSSHGTRYGYAWKLVLSGESAR